MGLGVGESGWGEMGKLPTSQTCRDKRKKESEDRAKKGKIRTERKRGGGGGGE